MEITEFQKHIRLVVDDELKDIWPIMFLKTIKKVGPSGVLDSVQVTDKMGTLTESRMRIYRDYTGEYIYEVPLTRHLEHEEVENIANTWNALYDGDFRIECSTPQYKVDFPETKMIKQDQYYEMCKEITKRKHDSWVQDKIEKGWRWGPKFNSEQKTHPLLRYWNDLPSEYQKVDMEQPKVFLDMLDRYGFGVYQKTNK